MITVHANPVLTIEGVSRHECAELATLDPIRQAEIISIRRFIECQREVFLGRVLDYGAGKPGTCRKPEPYRDLITGQHAEYLPYDRGFAIPEGPFNVIVCTQVLQYMEDPLRTLRNFRDWLHPTEGTLVMTYPTNWSESEESDLWRFTRAGMDRMLVAAGFNVRVHHLRGDVRLGSYHFPLGYGVVAVPR